MIAINGDDEEDEADAVHQSWLLLTASENTE
jgi:hypothetical protein